MIMQMTKCYFWSFLVVPAEEKHRCKLIVTSARLGYESLVAQSVSLAERGMLGVLA